MAQTFTSTACQTFGTTGFFMNPPKYIDQGMIIKSATFNFGAPYASVSATAGAVIQMVPVPKGCQVHDVILQWDALGGGVYTVTVGDTGNASRYIGSTSVTGSAVTRMGTNLSGVVATSLQNGGMGYSYSAETTINITVGTGTNATATGALRLSVIYSMDNNQKG
jgi:hypothetical protein